jgi:hypothetical protein
LLDRRASFRVITPPPLRRLALPIAYEGQNTAHDKNEPDVGDGPIRIVPQEE